MMQHRHNMMFKREFICAIGVLVLATLANAKQIRIKRMYAMCPPHFQRIGRECYYISNSRVNWLDAHFECKDRNSRLAEPYKNEDRLLRKYMMRADKSRTEFWIGGIYNWQWGYNGKWQWGYNGRDMKYQSFSQMGAGNKQDLKFHCAILDPHLKYRWSASSCVDRHNYICQHRMPYVNEKNRQKVYTKWNETYPNEMANEIEEVINDDELLRNNRHGNRRLHHSNQQRKINERKNHVNSIQTRLDDQTENRIDVQRPNAIPQNTRGHRNDVQNSSFEPQFNRSDFYKPRNRPDFGDNNGALLKRQRQHQYRRKHWPSTTTTTTTTTTAIQPTTTIESVTPTIRPMPTEISSATGNPDGKERAASENELAEERYRLDQEELERYEEKSRRKQYEEQMLMKEEERRIYEENEIREKQFKKMEERRLESEKELQKEADNERLRKEKQRQDKERKRQNEQNLAQYEKEKEKQAAILRQRELDGQMDAPATLTPVLSNDVLDNRPTIASTQPIKSIKKLSVEERKRRRDALRKRVQKLTPEEQRTFFEKRNERSRKRGINKRANDDQQTN